MRVIERLTPRERWFWIGVGFACGFFVLFALTVILIGVFFARFLPARAPSSPIAVQPAAPPLPSQIVRAKNPSPGPSPTGGGVTVAASDRSNPPARVSRQSPLSPWGRGRGRGSSSHASHQK